MKQENAHNDDDGEDISIKVGAHWPPAIGEIHYPCRMEYERWVRGNVTEEAAVKQQ